jgi:para-nitrobenzyl esterase
MKQLFPTIVLSFVVLASGFGRTVEAKAQLATVKTSNGSVSGYTSGSVAIFKGIPFAAPPVGDLRWKAPQPAKDWNGVRECKTWPASAMQAKPGPFMMWTEEFIAPPEPLSEDCLYLNIWTAALSGEKKLPVMVWIHGGGFTGGAGSCAVYDGEEMAKQGIVFVTINYRLGVFGFFSLPELAAESSMKVSGNYGLLDQIAALEWIRDNITAFGGDPSNVTIAGQSAGSMSVNALIASPPAKGLFHKAILQSGGLFSNRMMKTMAEGEKSGLAFMERAKAGNLAALRQMSAEDIQKAASGMSFGGFGPVQDGKVIPNDLVEYFKAGRQNDVPIMTGWVTGDGALFGPANGNVESFLKLAKERYGDRASEFLKLFPANDSEQCKASQKKLSLISFAVLSSHDVALFSKHKAYLYEFSHVPPDKPGFPNYGAFHTSDVPYALHSLNLWNRPWTPADLELEHIMSAYWANFARSGDPNGEGLPNWPNFDQKSGSVQELDLPVSSKPALFAKELEFLANKNQSNK